MRKVAIFVEGQTEQIFTRHVLLKILDSSKLRIEFRKFIGNVLHKALPDHANAHAKVYFLVIDAGNDEKVLTHIKERERGLFENGFERVIGLRDMYSGEYDKESEGKISNNVTRKFVEAHRSAIQKMSTPSKVEIYFAIMEIEAWFLGMHKVFARINRRLDVGHIKKELGYDLSRINPQTKFFRPTVEVDRIFRLVRLRYSKKKSRVERLVQKIVKEDFDDAVKNRRCRSLKDFYGEIARWCA